MADLSHEYRSLLKFLYRAPIALMQTRTDGEIQMMTPVAAKLLLPLSRDARTINCFDALSDFSPDIRKLCTDFSDAAGTICDALTVEAAHVEKGSPRRLFSVSIIKLSRSTLIMMLADVTSEKIQAQQEALDRVAAKRRLAELSSDLEHTLSVVAVSIAREDLISGRFLASEHLRRSLGLESSAESFTTSQWLTRIHPDDRATFCEDRERAARGLQTTFRDFRFLRADGSLGYMAGRRYLESDDSGNPVSLVTFGIDVTDQRQSEREHLALAEQLSLATTAAHVGTFEVDASSGAVAWSAQTYALYGRPDRVGEDTRQIAREALSAPELARVARWKRGMLEGWGADSIEFALTWPDHKAHWLAARGRLRTDECGHPVSLIGVMWDVTERRRSEEAASAQRLAEQSSRAKTEFLSTMSHELRTPLNAIIGFSHLLQINRGNPLSAQQLGQVKHIQKAGKHLLQLISDLLDVSRIELGKLRIQCTRVWVDDLVRDAVQGIDPFAAESQVRVTVQPPNVRAAVLADATRLMQILINLLSNAVKYNRAGGEVTVRWERSGDAWLVVVADTGIGMTPAQQQALFQPFNRLGRDESSVPGVGIGLVVTRQLTEAMGGSLSVSSVPGVGSDFSLRLPVFPATEVSGP